LLCRSRFISDLRLQQCVELCLKSVVMAHAEHVTAAQSTLATKVTLIKLRYS
jgi:hypothetical protein